MKALFVFLAIVAVLSIGCNNATKSSENIEGTYVTHFQNEFNITDDTLIISSIKSSDNSYDVKRQTGFNKIRNGQQLPKEFKVAKWVSSYNSDKQLLQETDLGRQISILPGTHKLKLGASEYTKVK
ncbi:hypothetical protein [Mucilaginibacter sp. NFR10]|uniref:hypothetical protein n=1 Tax=Mucilaginibacter sp. NFR10 TaxID=1566292 RepID=UPI00087176D9|nr:hypothetical protein [Mucilaginibacter sp. NFR10]SCW38057.1 hypothetical protein SAMN03159284_00101 [Mucilaginibacter sp. NFR10]